MSLSRSQRRALEIINRSPGVNPKQFARLMWTASAGWKQHHRCGRGTSTGSAMALAGGGYLGKLRRLNLITHDNRLTETGRLALLSVAHEGAGDDE